MEVKGKRRYQSPKGNPSARITSTMTEFYFENGAENPYGKTDVMWAEQPKNGDNIDILFQKNITSVELFLQVEKKEKKDTFYKTKLYVSKSKVGENCVNYQLIGQFEKDIVDHKFTQEPIWCVRIELKEATTVKGNPDWIF